MKKDKLLCLLLIVFLFTGCKNRSKEQVIENKDTIASPIQEKKTLLALEEGTIKATDEDFGPVVKLTGRQHELPGELFKVRESEMLVKDDYLIIKGAYLDKRIFGLYQLPELSFVTTFGETGDAPDQFTFPHLVSTSQPDKIAYVNEGSQKFFGVDRSGTLLPVNIVFPKIEHAVHSNKQLFVNDDSVCYYVEVIRQGQALFKLEQQGDSLVNTLLSKLAFSPKHKTWSAYIGTFAAAPSGKRLAYAYKYFKRIVFLDTETGKERVVDFEKEGVTPANDIITLGPDNTTYYWGGMTATDDYVYFVYSGRTPIVVTQEVSKGDGYIFIEKFDWDGNLIRKYELDHWGPAVVDEKNGKIYQLFYNYDDPLFIYDMPE